MSLQVHGKIHFNSMLFSPHKKVKNPWIAEGPVVVDEIILEMICGAGSEHVVKITLLFFENHSRLQVLEY